MWASGCAFGARRELRNAPLQATWNHALPGTYHSPQAPRFGMHAQNASFAMKCMAPAKAYSTPHSGHVARQAAMAAGAAASSDGSSAVTAAATQAASAAKTATTNAACCGSGSRCTAPSGTTVSTLPYT